MENATKALLIAAAILIAILIISLSLVVYRMASETVGNVDLSEAEIAAYNSKFEAFEGDNVSGAQVNALLNTIVAHNSQNEERKVQALGVVDGKATTYVGTNDNKISKRADTNKYYKVQLIYQNSLVASITLTEKE